MDALRRQNRVRRVGRGFTLLELLVVFLILAVLMAVAVPRLGELSARRRLAAAVTRVRTDIDYARRMARAAGTTRSVVFKVSLNRYQLAGAGDLDHPGDAYVVDLGAEPYRAEIVSALFGTTNVLTFDGYGQVEKPGSVVLRVGAYQETLQIPDNQGNPGMPGPPSLIQ